MSDEREQAWVEIGHGVSIQRRYINGVFMGVAYRHPEDVPQGYSEGWVYFDSDAWTLVSDDPLTISPSLLCRYCGHHGFIRDGKWVPA